MARPVAHPVLEHEGRRGGVADRAAMRAAVGEAVHRVVSGLQIFQEIEVAVAIIEDGEIDEALAIVLRSEEHTSELQSLMRISYAVFCLKKKKYKNQKTKDI